jgi:hypothetical protein
MSARTVEIKRIYSDDPLVHYKDSTISPERTREEIDALLRTYGIKKSGWNWDLPNEVWVAFDASEVIEGQLVTQPVKIECSPIWDKANLRTHPPRRQDQINWKISMRGLHWYIKTHLETMYARQSGMIMAFLENVKVSEQQRVKDVIAKRLVANQALTYQEEEKRSNVRWLNRGDNQQ